MRSISLAGWKQRFAASQRPRLKEVAKSRLDALPN